MKQRRRRGKDVEGAMDVGVQGEGVCDGSADGGVGSELEHQTSNHPVTALLICDYLSAPPN